MTNSKVAGGLNVATKIGRKWPACAIGKSTLCTPVPAKGTSVWHVVVRKGGKGDVKKFKEVYVDTLGPMQCESLLGNRYAIHITEVSTRFVDLFYENKRWNSGKNYWLS
jgi:hypothetical protein